MPPAQQPGKGKKGKTEELVKSSVVESAFPLWNDSFGAADKEIKGKRGARACPAECLPWCHTRLSFHVQQRTAIFKPNTYKNAHVASYVPGARGRLY